jgi:hypothetical protein
VSLQQLAKELGFRRIATARALAKKCAQVPTRRLVPHSTTGQRAGYWTREQVERIKDLRRKEGYEVP